jgi:hypothetical protein
MHKRFFTLEEIYNEPGFREALPVSLSNYRGLHGYYQFAPGTDVNCCVQRPSGTLCKKAHRKGWLARVEGDAVTIIGGTCATTKFGADSIIGSDIAVATNQLDEATKRERLYGQITDVREVLKWCVDARAALSDNKAKIDALATGLGPAWSTLVNMSRSGNGEVQATGYTLPKRDKDGEIEVDGREVHITIGRLQFVEACNRDRSAGVRMRLWRLEAACRLPEPDLLKLRGKRLREVIATFADYNGVRTAVAALLEEMKGFERNDLTPLCFVNKEFEQRTKVARFVRDRAGIGGGKEGARAWLMRSDAEIKERNRVERIRFG